MIGAGKRLAGQVTFHVAHVSSSELSEVCHYGAFTRDPELFRGQTTLGNATNNTTLESLGVLRKTIGKTVVAFLEQRGGQSLRRRELEPLPVE